MKTLFLCTLLVLLMGLGYAQTIQDPVKWNCRTVRISKKIYRVIIEAKIYDSWHIYSLWQPEGEIGSPTKIKLSSKSAMKLVKSTREKGKLVEEEIAGYNVQYYLNQVNFEQDIEVNQKPPFLLSTYISYIACTDEQCLPENTIELTAVIK